MLGSEQPGCRGKETGNSCYRSRLLLINWTARQTVWWQQDLVLMFLSEGRDNSELQRTAPMESSHLTFPLLVLSRLDYRAVQPHHPQQHQCCPHSWREHSAHSSAELGQRVPAPAWPGRFACPFTACRRRGQGNVGLDAWETLCSASRERVSAGSASGSVDSKLSGTALRSCSVPTSC